MKIWIFIGRFTPPHKWHISTIRKSLKFNDLTIVILGSANVLNEQNPFDVINRWQMIEEHFDGHDCLIIESIDDIESDKQWVSEIWKIASNYIESEWQFSIYWWDFENDYAIKVLKEFESELWFDSLDFVEFNRKDLSFEHNWETKYYSSTLVRQCLKTNNIELLKKLLVSDIYNKTTKKNLKNTKIKN